MKPFYFGLILLLFVAHSLHADWPQFRGPDGQGHSDAKNIPIEWSETKNIAWKMPVPGEGWSSPVIGAGQIWMTSSHEGGKSLHAVCLDLKTGKLLYDVKVLSTNDPGPKHRFNGFASPTPVLDGERIYVHFGPRGTVCLDTKGKIVWKNTEYKYNVIQGAASSPILHKNFLVLTCDGIDHQFIAALDKRTGKVKWKQSRAHLEEAAKETHPGRKKINKMAYSTPLIQSINGKPQMVVSGAFHSAAFDPANGRELWWFPYTGFSIVGRPSYGNGLFYIVGSIRQDHFCIFAVKPGKGQLNDSQRVWLFSTGIGHVPSPLLVGKEIFAVHDGGVAGCIDALTGKELWRERLGGNHDASPTEIDGKLYFVNREGQTTVLSAGRNFKMVAKNKLNGVFKATPAVAAGALFLRSATHLYRIEEGASRLVAQPNSVKKTFVGSWDIGKSTPSSKPKFVMTLNADFSAKKSHVPQATGKWKLVNGEARIVWSDGWRDIIRPLGAGYLKIAFKPRTNFDSAPDNTDSAQKK